MFSSASGVPLPVELTPAEAVAAWPSDRPLAALVSGHPHRRWSRGSVLAEPTDRLTAPVCEGPGAGDPLDPLDVLHEAQRRWPDDLLVCAIGYDVGRSIERLPSQAPADRDWPAVAVLRCPRWAVYDNLERRWSAHGRDHELVAEQLAEAASAGDAAVRSGATGSAALSDFTVGPAVAEPDDAGHRRNVERVLDYIAAGDVFQVNLARRVTRRFGGSARVLAGALFRASPAWYGAYVELDPPRSAPSRALACLSPELLLETDPHGGVVTRPIKGTRPAAGDAADTQACVEELARSEKDRAELAMVVDLLRHDLGKVCRYGSIDVAEARRIEAHPTLVHGVATIRGRLRADVTLADTLRAVLPGGSITGAPKVRAMEIIDELEPARRGPYCGTVGAVLGGASVWNVAIRTAAIETDASGRGRIDQWVGGGVVADSDPAEEVRETWVKARAMDRVLDAAGREAGAGRLAASPVS